MQEGSLTPIVLTILSVSTAGMPSTSSGQAGRWLAHLASLVRVAVGDRSYEPGGRGCKPLLRTGPASPQTPGPEPPDSEAPQGGVFLNWGCGGPIGLTDQLNRRLILLAAIAAIYRGSSERCAECGVVRVLNAWEYRYYPSIRPQAADAYRFVANQS